MKEFNTKKLCRAGIIACVYALLNYCFGAISFGPIQLRVSEALTVLPVFYFESIPALFVGCVLSGIMGCGIYDVIIGASATLVSAILTRLISKIIKNKTAKFYLSSLPQIVINAFAVPLIFLLSGITERAYFVEVMIILASQSAVILTLGQVLYFAISKKVR